MSRTKDLQVFAESVSSKVHSKTQLIVDITEVPISDILSHITPREILEELGNTDFMREIDAAEVKEHYDLVDRSDLEASEEKVEELEKTINELEEELYGFKNDKDE